MLRVCSFWTDSERVSEVRVCGRRMLGGRRWRHREKSGLGKTVRDFTRMLVIVSSLVRWGLNW